MTFEWRTLTGVAIFALATFLSVAPSQACPDGQSETSFGICLPNAGGDIGNAAEHLKNEIVGQSAAPAIQAWVEGSRNSAIGEAQPIPQNIRMELRGFVEDDLMDRARFKVGDNGFFNSAAVTLRVNSDVRAITLIDVIVFRNQYEAFGDAKLWAHELFHVKQYRDWGTRDFSIRYARNFNEVEDPAYRFDNDYAIWKAQQIAHPGAPLAAGFPPPPMQPVGQQMGVFCQTAYGRFGPGPLAPVGSPCHAPGPYGPAPGSVVP